MEEMDEFDWIRDIFINPWEDYNFILIDTTPTKENIKLLIDLAFLSKRLNVRNRTNWLGSDNEDINTIIDYFNEHGKSYLRIDSENYLMYGWSLKPIKNWIRYSDIF